MPQRLRCVASPVSNSVGTGLERRVLFLGTANSGKTTGLYLLKLGEVVTTIPTIGFNVETIQSSTGVDVTAWDVGGQEKIRPLWRHYLSNTNAIFWFVNAASGDAAMMESVDAMSKILQEVKTEDEIMYAGLKLCFIATHTDAPGATPLDELVEKFIAFGGIPPTFQRDGESRSYFFAGSMTRSNYTELSEAVDFAASPRPLKGYWDAQVGPIAPVQQPSAETRVSESVPMSPYQKFDFFANVTSTMQLIQLKQLLCREARRQERYHETARGAALSTDVVSGDVQEMFDAPLVAVRFGSHELSPYVLLNIFSFLSWDDLVPCEGYQTLSTVVRGDSLQRAWAVNHGFMAACFETATFQLLLTSTLRTCDAALKEFVSQASSNNSCAARAALSLGTERDPRLTPLSPADVVAPRLRSVLYFSPPGSLLLTHALLCAVAVRHVLSLGSDDVAFLNLLRPTASLTFGFWISSYNQTGRNAASVIYEAVFPAALAHLHLNNETVDLPKMFEHTARRALGRLDNDATVMMLELIRRSCVVAERAVLCILDYDGIGAQPLEEMTRVQEHCLAAHDGSSMRELVNFDLESFERKVVVCGALNSDVVGPSTLPLIVASGWFDCLEFSTSGCRPMLPADHKVIDALALLLSGNLLTRHEGIDPHLVEARRDHCRKVRVTFEDRDVFSDFSKIVLFAAASSKATALQRVDCVYSTTAANGKQRDFDVAAAMALSQSTVPFVSVVRAAPNVTVSFCNKDTFE